MKFEVTLNEEQIRYISRFFNYQLDEAQVPPEFADAVNLFNGKKVSPKALEEFLMLDGEFQIKRAVSRVLSSCRDVDTGSYYYIGAEGWRTPKSKDQVITHKSRYGSWQSTSRGRVRTFDQTFDFAHKQGKVPELLKAVIDEGKEGEKLNTNCRYGLIGWLIENDYHKNESVIKQFLRGYFKGKEKVHIMDALLEDGELAKIEFFWKSRAYAVQSRIIEKAPIKDLPFMLATKNKRLLALIEDKMEEAIRLENAPTRSLKK